MTNIHRAGTTRHLHPAQQRRQARSRRSRSAEAPSSVFAGNGVVPSPSPERAVSPPGLIASSAAPAARVLILGITCSRRGLDDSNRVRVHASGRAPGTSGRGAGRGTARDVRARARDRRATTRAPSRPYAKRCAGATRSVCARHQGRAHLKHVSALFVSSPREFPLLVNDATVRTAACDRTVRQHTRRDVPGDAVGALCARASRRDGRRARNARVGGGTSSVLSLVCVGPVESPRRPNRGVGLSIARRGRPRRERRVVRAAFRAPGRPRRAREDARGEPARPRGRGRRAHARGSDRSGGGRGGGGASKPASEKKKKAGQEEQAPKSRLEARQGLFGLFRTNEARPWWARRPRRPRRPRRQGEGRFEDETLYAVGRLDGVRLFGVTLSLAEDSERTATRSRTRSATPRRARWVYPI